MADTNGRTTGNLIDILLSQPHSFNFFRAVRILQQEYPDRIGIGFDGPPIREIVKIRPEASFRFPPSAIALLSGDDTDPEKPLCMTVTFFGLYGRFGTLPWHYTNRIIHQERPSIEEKRTTNKGLRPFLDIFNHRLISLFYRAGTKYRWPLVYLPKRPGNNDDKGDSTTRNFIAFTGLATRHLFDDGFAMPESMLLRYAGIFMTPRSASTLATLLSDFLGARTCISQFVGEWLQVEADDRNRIGYIKGNNRLGTNFTIGKRIYSRQHRFRIVVGPTDFDHYTRLLPEEKAFEQLGSLVRLRSGVSMKFDCEMIVRRETVPKIALGRKLARLGRTFFTVSPKGKGQVAHPIFSTEGIKQYV